MRLRIILAVLVLFLLTLGFASAKTKTAPSANLQAFYGEVKKVDLAAKTITLQLGSSFVFHVTDETKISGPDGIASMDKIRPGEGASVVMRRGKDNTRIAVTIRLNPKATFASEPTARTVRGETISGFAVGEFVVYQPPASHGSDDKHGAERRLHPGTSFEKRVKLEVGNGAVVGRSNKE